MKLVLAETKYIRESVSIISELVSEARFKVSSDAIELIAMDPANVAMVIFKLFSSAFASYEVKEPITVAINLAEFKQVLRRIKPDDNLILEIDDNKLKITLKSHQTRTFRLPLLEGDDNEQKVPDLQFTADVVTNSSILTDAIEDMGIVGESVSVIVDKKQVDILSASELTNAKVNIPADKDTKITASAKTQSKYSIEYLKKMIQGAKLADTVKVALSKDYPVRIDYTVVDKLQMSFILAPRVDND